LLHGPINARAGFFNRGSIRGRHFGGIDWQQFVSNQSFDVADGRASRRERAHS
jgi:hypothetical protein